MDKLNGNSLDLVKANIEKLKELFPNIVSDGKINFDMLRILLNDEIDDSNEKYQFSWIGKSKAVRFSQLPSTGTLVPCKEISKNWDTTQNLYIEGDNVEVLKLLQKTYFGKIKMIYIDPPYNTGHDFVYNDDFKNSIENYKKITSQTNRANPDTNGRFHTDWLNMMYSRLSLARNLLTDDGVIFISIDDNEQANLKKICDEIFGPQNFITTLIWSAGKKNDSKYISVSHEYILCYVRSIDTLVERQIIWRERKKGLEDIYAKYDELKEIYGSNYSEISAGLKKWYKSLSDDNPAKAHSHYSLVDEKGIFFADNASWPGGGGPRYEVLHPVTNKPVKVPSRGWIYSTKERMQEMIDAGKIYFGPDETYVPCIKSYLKDREMATPYSVFYKDGRASTKRLRDLLGGMFFQNPKDEDIIMSLINLTLTNKDSIVLDFFSGSATTAHSVFKMNAVDGGNRKFIMVQLPELCEEGSEAHKNGYRNICEIGEERIRRAGKKIYDELKAKYDNAGLLVEDCINPDDLDLGFKVFKLESTNIKPWDSSIKLNEVTLLDQNETIKEGRTNLDVAFEIMLKYGVFNMPLKEVVISNKQMFDIGMGHMIICLDDEITMDDVAEIAKLKPHCVVFKESGFKDDNEKMNATYTLERFKVEKVLCI